MINDNDTEVNFSFSQYFKLELIDIYCKQTGNVKHTTHPVGFRMHASSPTRRMLSKCFFIVILVCLDKRLNRNILGQILKYMRFENTLENSDLY